MVKAKVVESGPKTRSVYPVTPIAKTPSQVQPRIDGSRHTSAKVPTESLSSATGQLQRNHKGQFIKRVSSECSQQFSNCEPQTPKIPFYPSNAAGSRLC
jgi:hypothetical protein